MFDFSLHQLKSGLKVILLPLKSSPSLTAMLLAKTGSRYENPGEEGIAHFFEHIVFKGSKNYPSAQNLAETVDGIGAEFNAFTSKEYTGYYVKAASRHLDLALDVLSDMILLPLLKEEDIAREKGVIIEEMNMYKDMPAAHVSDLFEEMAFAKHGLAHQIVGEKETVLAINQQKFQNFLATWYNLNNLTLVIAGDGEKLGQKNLLSKIDHYFAKNPKHKEGKLLIDANTHQSRSLFSAKKILLHSKKTEQSHFTFAWPSIKRDDRHRHTLSLLNVILGGNMSSRLFTEVREKRGLAYYVHSEVRQFHEGGMFGASVGVDPSRIEEALKVSLAEFTKILDKKSQVDNKELNKAKEYIMGKMLLNFEDSENLAQAFGIESLLFDRLETFQETIDGLKAVTCQDILDLATQIVQPGKVKLALIGDYEDQRKFEKIVSKY